MAPAHEFLPRVQTVESLLTRTVERQWKLPFREQSRPKKEIREKVQLYLSTPRAASFAITIRVGRAFRQTNLLDTGENVVLEFLECLHLFSEDKREELLARIPDKAYLLNFLHQARRLAPDGERITAIGFTVADGGHFPSVALRGPMSIDWFTRNGDSETTVTFDGVLTQAKKDRRENVIGVRRDKGGVDTVHVPPGLMNDIVRPLWDRRVRINGRNKKKGVWLQSIEPIDDGDAE